MQENTIPHHPDDAHQLPPEPQKEGWRSITSTLLILLAAPLVAFLLTSFVFQSYEVEGPSMERTLQNRDRLIVLKLGKTWSSLFDNNFVPKRGEVVIFHRPQNAGAATEGDKQIIKRVIALPGEKVEVGDGVLTVYNAAHPEGFQPDAEGNYLVEGTYTAGEGTWTLKEDEVFVSGDNRGNSLDSRNFGPIKTDDLVGSLWLRVFPFNKFDSF